MTTILRWHIVRIVEQEQISGDEQGRVHINITPEAPNKIDLKLKDDPRKMAKAFRDDLEWWEDDEDAQLEGWTTRKALRSAFITRNIFSDSISSGDTMTKRDLEEDMVLLQFVKDEDSLEKVWEKLKGKKALPDVSALLAIEDTSWVDFTQPARNMVATLYRQVLGEQEGD